MTLPPPRSPLFPYTTLFRSSAIASSSPTDSIHVQGWVRTRRDSKDFSFIELNDGSSLKNLQIIARNSLPNYADVQKLTTRSEEHTSELQSRRDLVCRLLLEK